MPAGPASVQAQTMSRTRLPARSSQVCSRIDQPASAMSGQGGGEGVLSVMERYMGRKTRFAEFFKVIMHANAALF